MRNARIDQPGFFTARDHFDRESKGGLGAWQEIGNIARDAKRVGRDCPDAIGVKTAQAVPKALEHIDGALDRLVAQHFGGIQASGQAHRFLKAIDLENVARVVFLDHAAD